MNVIVPPRDPIEYPDSDGRPMSDNTKQGRWIVLFFGNLCALFRHQVDVFVAQNLLWYALEGHPEVCAAPDVLVVFSRPKGDRGSYKQWEEDTVPLTVVFEIMSPGNTIPEMAEKFSFYEEYGVEEYYIYDPDTNMLQVFIRRGEMLRAVKPVHNFVSPRLGIRFDMSGSEMVVWRPNNKRFLSFEELQEAWEQESNRAELAEKQRQEQTHRAEIAEKLRQEQAQRAEVAERQRQDEAQRAEAAEKQKAVAIKRAESAERQIEDAARRADQLSQQLARLADLSRKARRGEATAEELAELERLEASLP